MEEQEPGFEQYKLLILETMKRHEDAQKIFNEKIDAMNSAVAELKVKAGFAGAAAGVIASAFVSWIFKK